MNLKEIEQGIVWNNVAQYRNQRRVLMHVNTIMNIRIPYNAGDFTTA
jgi:hypothetical protein